MLSKMFGDESRWRRMGWLTSGVVVGALVTGVGAVTMAQDGGSSFSACAKNGKVLAGTLSVDTAPTCTGGSELVTWSDGAPMGPISGGDGDPSLVVLETNVAPPMTSSPTDWVVPFGYPTAKWAHSGWRVATADHGDDASMRLVARPIAWVTRPSGTAVSPFRYCLRLATSSGPIAGSETCIDESTTPVHEEAIAVPGGLGSSFSAAARYFRVESADVGIVDGDVFVEYSADYVPADYPSYLRLVVGGQPLALEIRS